MCVCVCVPLCMRVYAGQNVQECIRTQQREDKKRVIDFAFVAEAAAYLLTGDLQCLLKLFYISAAWGSCVELR